MQTGTCRFCGQVQNIDIYDASQDELNKEAVERCSCTQAKIYSNRLSQIERAEIQMDEMFGIQSAEKYKLQAIDGDIIENIKNMLPIIQEERIKNISITVVMKDQIKINIGYSNDKFSIKRSESNSVKREI